MKRLRLAITALAFVAAASPAFAQSVDGSRSGLARPNLISANPIGLLFQWYNAEFEHAVAPTVSLAVAASSYDFDNARYGSVDGIVRYYPAARAVKGFSIGASVGFIDINEDPCEFCSDDSGSSATVGVRADYVWIIGRDQHFSAQAGVGAKRLFNNDLGTEGVPIGRLSIGWAW
ncbi:MAG: DUF3575 domain-containing protein [Gemmatimonadales bacterium]